MKNTFILLFFVVLSFTMFSCGGETEIKKIKNPTIDADVFLAVKDIENKKEHIELLNKKIDSLQLIILKGNKSNEIKGNIGNLQEQLDNAIEGLEKTKNVNKSLQKKINDFKERLTVQDETIRVLLAEKAQLIQEVYTKTMTIEDMKREKAKRQAEIDKVLGELRASKDTTKAHKEKMEKTQKFNNSLKNLQNQLDKQMDIADDAKKKEDCSAFLTCLATCSQIEKLFDDNKDILALANAASEEKDTFRAFVMALMRKRMRESRVDACLNKNSIKLQKQ